MAGTAVWPGVRAPDPSTGPPARCATLHPAARRVVTTSADLNGDRVIEHHWVRVRATAIVVHGGQTGVSCTARGAGREERAAHNGPTFCSSLLSGVHLPPRIQ